MNDEIVACDSCGREVRIDQLGYGDECYVCQECVDADLRAHGVRV